MSDKISKTKFGTIAIILEDDQWVETLSDEREVEILVGALECRLQEPLGEVYRFRARQEGEDELFGDHIENLLTKPFVKPEIREHGVKWLESRVKIEKFRKEEKEAAQIIASFALQKREENPKLQDFQIVSDQAEVRVRIFKIQKQRMIS